MNQYGNVANFGIREQISFLFNYGNTFFDFGINVVGYFGVFFDFVLVGVKDGNLDNDFGSANY